ncbi:regulatory protein, LysR:LysR, partial [Mycolicibacterium canariasense]
LTRPATESRRAAGRRGDLGEDRRRDHLAHPAGDPRGSLGPHRCRPGRHCSRSGRVVAEEHRGHHRPLDREVRSHRRLGRPLRRPVAVPGVRWCRGPRRHHRGLRAAAGHRRRHPEGPARRDRGHRLCRRPPHHHTADGRCAGCARRRPDRRPAGLPMRQSRMPSSRRRSARSRGHRVRAHRRNARGGCRPRTDRAATWSRPNARL